MMTIRALRRQWAGLLILCAALPVIGALSPAIATDTVPTPKVSQPPAGNGVAFPGTRQDIAHLGYAESEVLFEGTARSFVPSAPLDNLTDGRWNAAPTGPTATYKTRMLIYAPIDPARFNGTVLVEWLNVSGGRDADSFDGLGEAFMRSGYVYVGVSAQAVGANQLRDTADPARYGSIVHPGDSYSYDIFSQAAKALRAGNPATLGNWNDRIKALVAWGGSQSGARLITYINAVNPTARVFDGFLPFISGAGAALTQDPLPTVRVPPGPQQVIRTDMPTPVLFENSESELVGSARGLHLEPDSAHFRLWEFAGTSHAQRIVNAAVARPTPGTPMPVGVSLHCDNPPANDLNVRPIWRAMLNAMDVWLKTGKAPAKGARVALIIPADAAQPATFDRDPKTGIAKGGVRLPDVAVPTRTLWGTPPEAALTVNPNCRLFGAADEWNGDRDPWDADPALKISPKPEPSLKALYGTSGKYVAAVKKSADALVTQGFLLAPDAEEIVGKAKTVVIQ